MDTITTENDRITSAFDETTSTPLDFDETALWIASMTFTFIAVPFLCYLIVALCYHGYKKKLMLCCGDSGWSLKNRATSIVNSVILFACFTILIYVSIEIPLVVPPEEPFCPIYHRIKITSYIVSIAAVYFFLWYRVYTVFYINPVLKQNMSKLLQVVNMSTLVFLAIMIISNLVLFLIAPPYATKPYGCSPVQSIESNRVKWAVLFTCTTTFQISLLFSFIYPLYMHRRKMLDRGFDAKSTIPVVKRAAIVAGVCVVSDLISSGFAIAYKNPTVYINHIVYSSNLMVNLNGAILSFSNWKEKLILCINHDERMTQRPEVELQPTNTSAAGVQGTDSSEMTAV